MDLERIVSELRKERDRINRAIAALEEMEEATTSPKRAAAPIRAGRKAKRKQHLTPEGRKRLSDMMKKRWAERRKKNGLGRKAA
jgi:Spy/CpxP family protein refolding chaperone